MLVLLRLLRTIRIFVHWDDWVYLLWLVSTLVQEGFVDFKNLARIGIGIRAVWELKFGVLPGGLSLKGTEVKHRLDDTMLVNAHVFEALH